jgi:MFS family permease
VLTTWRSLSGNRPIMAMTLLSGAAAACIGTAYQAQMPGFAHDLGHGNPGIAYGSLLAADAAGALAAGILLESRSLLPASPRTALLLGMLWCLAIGGFALAPSYAVALPLLLAAGFLELAFNAMSQTIVQLNAPPAQRGRIIGLFITASLGLRAVSGITVGFGGALLGIHASLAASAAGLLVCVLLIARWLRQAPDGSPAAAG